MRDKERLKDEFCKIATRAFEITKEMEGTAQYNKYSNEIMNGGMAVLKKEIKKERLSTLQEVIELVEGAEPTDFVKDVLSEDIYWTDFQDYLLTKLKELSPKE